MLRRDGTAPVFFDPRGRRAYLVLAISWFGSVLVGVLLACLLLSSIYGPAQAPPRLSAARALSAAPARLEGASEQPMRSLARASHPEAAAATRYGHYVTWDENGFSSLKRNAHKLDVMIAEWLHLADGSGKLAHASPFKESMVRKWVTDNAPDLRILPLVNNYDLQKEDWDVHSAQEMLDSPERRATFIQELYALIASGGYTGVVLDLERLPDSALGQYRILARQLSDHFHARGLTVLVAVPPDNPLYGYRELAEVSDGLLVMTYDEHQEAGEPGPLAGQGWFEHKLQRLFDGIDPKKIIVGIGSYAYDWPGPGKGKELSVQEAWELLEQSGAQLNFDASSLNPSFGYVEDSARHQVWYLDAVTGYNQIAAAMHLKAGGLALWRLGTEDPGIWAAFGRGRLPDEMAREATSVLRSGYDLLYKGKGEVLEVTSRAEPGERRITFDPEQNLIVGQEIDKYPKSNTVSRSGGKPNAIALTFDDGPDRTFTPKILDILAEKDVKATFFVVGMAGVANPDILQRLYREGHDIGNHTFTHLNAEMASPEHVNLEINATQRAIEAAVGARTTLFRPPYGRHLGPQTVDGAETLSLAASLGYITIDVGVDPRDWARHRADQIVARTLEEIDAGTAHVITLHDAGGNRTATVEALPQLIDQLRIRGYDLVTVHELLGLQRDQILPPVGPDDAFIVATNQAGFGFLRGLRTSFAWLVGLSLVLGTLRLVFVAALGLAHAWREKRRSALAWRPSSVAVLIPAFNEEKVICKTVHALLACRHRKFHIFVIDDGSNDRTADVVQGTFFSKRVHVIRKPNGGKWSALNEGLYRANADIVVTLDGDTVFAPDALPLLIRHFADPKVAAVAGSANVGNRINLITKFQALEYVINQNLDRRALELVNGITVVPGSISAWRREALLQVGGFAGDTLAEDADATIRLERAGWKVIYEISCNGTDGGTRNDQNILAAAATLDVWHPSGGV